MVKAQISVINELLQKSDWRDPIPFFKNRIEDAKKFSQEKDINNHTDHFKMVKEN